MKPLIVLAVLLSINGTGKAQDTTIARQGPTAEASIAGSEQRDSLVIALTAQVEQMRAYDNRLLATVYWTLGALGAVFASLIGFSWFVNFKIYDRDREALTALVTQRVEQERGDLADTISNELRDGLSRIEVDLDGKIDSLGERLNSQILIVRRTQDRTQFDLHRLTAEIKRSNKQYGNALSAYIAAAEIAKKQKNCHSVSYIVSELEEMLSEQKAIFATDFHEIAVFADSIEETNRIDAERLRKLLNDIRKL